MAKQGWWQNCYVINDTGGIGGKYATGFNNTGGKFCHQFCWCCLHRWQIFHRCQQRRWQIIGTISGCRHLKMNLKAKFYIYDNFSTQRCPNNIIKNFLIEDFFHFPPESLTPVVHVELQISPRIFEKI